MLEIWLQSIEFLHFFQKIFSVFIFRQNATVQKNHFPITTIVLCTDLVILAIIRLLLITGLIINVFDHNLPWPPQCLQPGQ